MSSPPPPPPPSSSLELPIVSGNTQTLLNRNESSDTTLDTQHRESPPKIGVTAPSKKASRPFRSSIPSFVPTSQVVKLQSTMNRLKDLLTPNQSSASLTGLKKTGQRPTGKFTIAKEATTLFPPTTQEVDGDECLHDCDSCTVALPRKWEIDESDQLYGHVKGWDYHVVVGTGKSDWVRDVIDEKGSLMEGLGVHGLEIQPTRSSSAGDTTRRRVMLSASNMPTGGVSDGEIDGHGKTVYEDDGKTSAIVLPAWKFVEGVSKNEVSWFMNDLIGGGPSNLDHLDQDGEEQLRESPSSKAEADDTTNGTSLSNGGTQTNPRPYTNGTSSSEHQPEQPPDISKLDISRQSLPASVPTSTIPPGIRVRTLQHKALILMCSHKTRDARCGQSAPLLRREFERHLRPLGLYRDLHDDRPDGVGIYFINHVGGHKYSANMMIYRRSGSSSTSTSSVSENEQAVQGIWLARVRPEDCENIVRYTVLQGKVVKPARQLRGGFDRSCGLASW